MQCATEGRKLRLLTPRSNSVPHQ